MSSSEVYVSPALDLQIKEAEVILNEIRVRACGWSWTGTVALFDRLERVISEIRGDIVPRRVALDLEAFGELIRGREVVRPGVRILLQDVGWAAMATELADAMAHVEDQSQRGLTTLEEGRPHDA